VVPIQKNTKFCQHCGAEIDELAEICPKCGVRIKGVTQTTVKNEGIAVVLSFFFVGLGQIYNGQIGKGILFILVGVILILTMAIFIGFILYPLFWVYNMYDAYDTAKKINAGQIIV